MQRSIAFRYIKDADRHLHRIVSVGRDSVTDRGYSWDGMTRPSGGSIFQYTLSGEGRLRVGTAQYHVPASHAFVLSVPGDHRYYYDPASGEPWSFIWLRIDGPGVGGLVRDIHEKAGPLLQAALDESVIRLLHALYDDLNQGKLRSDKYAISLRVYEWVLALLAFTNRDRGPDAHNEDIPAPFARAAQYLDSRYMEQVALDQVAAFAGLSKHHLCRTFARYYGFTPVHYLRRRRVSEALRLLRDTDLPAQDVAARTGFDSLGYFGKVFRALVGMSPTEYRLGRHDLDAPYITLLD